MEQAEIKGERKFFSSWVGRKHIAGGKTEGASLADNHGYYI